MSAERTAATLDAARLAPALAALRSGTPYRRALEALLLELDDASADALMVLLQESRGSWGTLVHAPQGDALYVGNALSGTTVGLGSLGYRVTIVDPSSARCAFALYRARAYDQASTRAVAARPDALPFPDRLFSLVVHEPVAPGVTASFDAAGHELARVARHELALVCDNRFAYKRSTGRRGRFAIPSPGAWLARAAAPPTGEHSLRGHRRRVSRALGVEGRTRAFSLYPHANNFSHVVGLDGKGPHLTIGPKERANRPKFAAYRSGLFPWLTPSFAVVAGRDSTPSSSRIARALTALAGRLGEPSPIPEVLVSSRSNTAVVHTCVPGRGEDDPAGRWTLHVPLNPQKRKLVQKHVDLSRYVRELRPGVPVPEPLFLGPIEGLWMSVERRLPGLAAPHLSGVPEPSARLLRDTATHLASLSIEPARPFGQADFDSIVAPRFEVVRDHAARAETERALDHMGDEVRERLIGRPVGRFVYHGDLRGKHVQVDPDGRVLGYLDWGAGEESFLPYIDLLHLLAHQRKQEEGCSARRAWQVLRERQLAPREEAAIEQYVELTGLDPEVRAALELAFPVFVAGMAELHWDFSRPRWLHREFGV